MARQLPLRGGLTPYRLQAPRPLGAGRAGPARPLAWQLAAAGLAALLGVGSFAIFRPGPPGHARGQGAAVAAVPPAETALPPAPAEPAAPAQAVTQAVAAVPSAPAVAPPGPPSMPAELAQPVAVATTAVPMPVPVPVQVAAPAPAPAVALAPAPAPAPTPVRPVEEPQATAAIEPPSAVPAAPSPSASAAHGKIASDAGTPTDCVAPELLAVLDDVAAKFGAVTLVSTTHLHTDNHSAGSVREKLHHACKAVDFKTKGGEAAVRAYLHGRPEVAGINGYRNGVIHIDLNERFAATRGAKRAARR